MVLISSVPSSHVYVFVERRKEEREREKKREEGKRRVLMLLASDVDGKWEKHLSLLRFSW